MQMAAAVAEATSAAAGTPLYHAVFVPWNNYVVETSHRGAEFIEFDVEGSKELYNVFREDNQDWHAVIAQGFVLLWCFRYQECRSWCNESISSSDSCPATSSCHGRMVINRLQAIGTIEYSSNSCRLD